MVVAPQRCPGPTSWNWDCYLRGQMDLLPAPSSTPSQRNPCEKLTQIKSTHSGGHSHLVLGAHAQCLAEFMVRRGDRYLSVSASPHFCPTLSPGPGRLPQPLLPCVGFGSPPPHGRALPTSLPSFFLLYLLSRCFYSCSTCCVQRCRAMGNPGRGTARYNKTHKTT